MHDLPLNSPAICEDARLQEHDFHRAEGHEYLVSPRRADCPAEHGRRRSRLRRRHSHDPRRGLRSPARARRRDQPPAIANTRTNAARVALPADTLDVVQLDMLEFLRDGSIRDAEFARFGLPANMVDLVFSNPPYVPVPADPVPRPVRNEVPTGPPASDLGLSGSTVALAERILAIRSMMMAAEDGGPDGLRYIRELLTCVPCFASRLAWLQGSYSSPLVVLASLPWSGWIIEQLVAYAVCFGKYSMARGTPLSRHLNALRNDGRSFFWSASPDGPHWFIVLGFSVCRSKPPAGYDWNALARVLHGFLHTFTAKGPDALVHCRVDLPFAVEIGIYQEP